MDTIKSKQYLQLGLVKRRVSTKMIEIVETRALINLFGSRMAGSIQSLPAKLDFY